MPHGAGHVGGGHHGHHGGGYHHHHHHYGHHHSRGWYWGGPVYHRYGYRRRGISCVVASVLIFVVILPLSIALGLRYGAVSLDDDNLNSYALTDKVVRDYSNVFCQSLSAESFNVRRSSSATLYMLSSPPPLYDVERFNFSEPVSLDSEGDFKQWNFYLNRGSKVSLKVCYDSSDPSWYGVDFVLIRGDGNFNSWKNDEANSFYSIKYRHLSSQCQTITYNVSKSDRFYFTFYADQFLLASLSVDFHFERTVYRVNQSTVVENCTIPLDASSSCSVSVPLTAAYTALLSLNTSPPVDYSDQFDVYITCQPRAWMYAVIAVSVLVPATAILACVLVCVCVLVKKNKQKYTPLQGNDASTVATPVNADTGEAVGNPPPYNPQYSPSGGGYGATATTPGSTQYTHVYPQQ